MTKTWQLAVLLLLLSWGVAAEEDSDIASHFLSEGFELSPGDVNDDWIPIEFPKGHIAVKRFDAEVVDEEGKPVLLNDLYLHHWVVSRVHTKKGHKRLRAEQFRSGSLHDRNSDAYLYDDAGTCKGNQLRGFGRGSETRRTNTYIPAPYGLVFGDPAEIPEGYEEVWYLNVHGIDTRDAISAKDCLECLCKSYNVTTGKNGLPLKQGYTGGWDCCYDKTHCVVKPDSTGGPRKMHLKYTIDYVPYTKAIKPLRSYLIDVTDQRTSLSQQPGCKVEYNVEQCSEGSLECVHQMSTVAGLDVGGDVVYMVGHQHLGGLGVDVVREDGTKICESRPIYGDGNSPGNEAGYVVGMTSCRPAIGTAYVKPMELLRSTSYYSSAEAHTGVMGMMYILVGDHVDANDQSASQENAGFDLWKESALVFAAFAAGVVIGLSVNRYMKSQRKNASYEALMNSEIR